MIGKSEEEPSTVPHFVSIPLRGDVIGKESSSSANGTCLDQRRGFHPLAGRCDRKEFTSGTVAGKGFEIPQSTPLFGVSITPKKFSIIRDLYSLETLLCKQSTPVNEIMRFSRFWRVVSMSINTLKKAIAYYLWLSRYCQNSKWL